MQALSKQGIVYASHAFAGQGILVMLAFHCMGRLFLFSSVVDGVQKRAVLCIWPVHCSEQGGVYDQKKKTAVINEAKM